MSHPFQGASVEDLYASEARTIRRSDALLTAKTSGRNITDVVLGYADTARLPPAPGIVEIGCGQGRTAVRLARHRPGGSVLAIMCLYHSPVPHCVIAEITRILRPTGTAVLVTKATNSYRELADLLERSGLDTRACERPSLYEIAHSGNLHHLAQAGDLAIRSVEHEQHTFTFAGLAHVAAYLTTCPQYPLPPPMRHPKALADALRARLPDRPVITTATITYLVGGPA